MTNPATSMNKDEFSAWNERMAHEYDPEQYHASTNPIVRFVERKRVECILRLMDARPEHRVLEVGVGAGNILEQVHSEHRVGLDLSPFLLEKAKKRLGPSVSLLLGDAEALHQFVQPGSFDRIYCSEVLEHVQHPENVLSEMAAALKPDGRVVVSVPNEGMINTLKGILKSLGVFRLLFPTMADHMEDEWHLRSFDRILLRQLASSCFVIESIQSVPFCFLPIRLVAKLRLKQGSASDGTLFSRMPVTVTNGIPDFVTVAQRSDIEGKMGRESRFKDFFKRWPTLYAFFFAVIGPSFLTGMTSKRFVAGLQSTDRVLHAGSGTRRLGTRSVNVDLFPFEGVDVAADLSDLPFRDGVFDAVTCDQVLEHVKDPKFVASELFRVTRVGGLIHVASPFVFPWHPSPSDYTRWTQEGLTSLFPDCEMKEQGIMAGPFSALNAFLAAFFATVFCFGSKKLQGILQYLFLVLLFPIKYFDVLFAHMPGAELCAANFYVVMRK